jgi:hypothetical protein
MSLLAALDRFVHATRLDILTPYAGREPRNLRWAPLLALLAAVAGYGLLVIYAFRPGVDWQATLWRGFAAGALFWVGFGAANLVRLFGPRIAAEQGRLDEREHMLKARAGSVSGHALSLIAILGCFYCAFAPAAGLWRPESSVEWVYSGLLLEAFAFALPVLVASWMQPRLEPDE